MVIAIQQAVSIHKISLVKRRNLRTQMFFTVAIKLVLLKSSSFVRAGLP